MALRRLPGTARRYLDTDTGEVLSRRQADARRELAGQRSRLDAATRANLARARQKYQDHLKTATRAEFQRIDTELEKIEAQLSRSDKATKKRLKELRKQFKQERRTIKKRKREAPEFKRALKTLRTAKASDIKAIETPSGEMSDKQRKLLSALKILGKRDDIPDWVPPGLSDRYRHGTLRRSRIPQWAFKSERPPRTKQQRIKGR